MAARGSEKFTQRQVPRPSLQSQHSNSVPSTPYQQPRDLRFHSRSPSPRRGLSNQSPRSVLSEAVDSAVQNGSLRGGPSAPVVCKFETAPEWRKRRIPYVDGGDEELGPPQKSPKGMLEPHEEDKLSGDMRELYDRILPSDESEQRRAQLVQKLDRILNEEWPGHDIKVSVFGSSGNLLSSSDSDVDICVTTSLKKVESMHTLAMLLHKNGMERVVCRAAAKVPIVKCWDPTLQLACDVNVNNPLALENTRMIKTYVQLDSRVRPLAKIVKYWTKQRILNDAAFGGTISSYTWSCMIISFLQRREPPVLPSLQKIPCTKRSTVDGKESDFADDLESLKGFGDNNKETLAALLFHFFRHYAYEFEYSKYVISVKEGRLLSRKEKGWDNYADNKEARCRLCVEEPFNTQRNLGNSADDYAWSGIHGEIRRAFELLADDASLEKCCEKFVFPIEEKPIFQRPAPKPKPTLTRSASQSGPRPSHEAGGTTRSRKGGNRNASSQRAGNRRASSGAVFGNQRLPFLPSPQIGSGLSPMDYFAAKGNLHDQLFQQYQYLQAQQDVLRSQLVAQQQQQQQQKQAQSQARLGESSGTSSPRHRHTLANSRFLDNPPATAPLLPGYLYHYPARYPPPQSHALHHNQRSREGSSTNPSSPSFAPAIPATTRQSNHAPSQEGSNSSMRSQSQPGRSLPHPITLQQQVHPGYDVSGALGGSYQNFRSSQGYHPGLTAGFHLPFSAMPPLSTNGFIETAMPKEYVGYYVGQSPQLGPQYANANQIHVPPITSFRDPPQRPRRVTPDLMPPIANGSHGSRSPSPLGRSRIVSTAADSKTGYIENVLPRASGLEEPLGPPLSLAPSPSPSEEVDNAGPIIVNGSNPPPALKSQERPNGIHVSAFPKTNGGPFPDAEPAPTQLIQSSSLQSEHPVLVTSDIKPETIQQSRHVSPNPYTKTTPRLSLSPNGIPNGSDHVEYHDPSPSSAAPLLSPVAEMRTPSPTQSKRFDVHASPQQPHANGYVKAATLAKATATEKATLLQELCPPPPISPVTKHERKGSAPNPTLVSSKPAANSPTPPSPLNMGFTMPIEKNPWQQATGRKGHKKNKSAVGLSGGQKSPVSENERKGG